MNLYTQGWLGEYLKLRERDPGSAELGGITEPDEILYRLLQPTGLMYGHPIQTPISTELRITSWDTVTKMKLIFVESMLHVGRMNLPGGDPGFFSTDYNEQLIHELNDYYLNLYPKLYRGKLSSTFDDPVYIAELLLEKRLKVNTSLMNNYLANLFHNSLLFLDVFFFGQWVRELGSVSSRKLREEKQNLRLAILGVMAYASNADQTITPEEKALFEFFLRSADLNPQNHQLALNMLKSPVDPQNLYLPYIESWILRRYLLEMAILVSWSDRELSTSELRAVQILGEKLNFTPDQVSESLIAVEAFVIDHWEGMHYLWGKHNFEQVSNRFIRRLQVFIHKNKDYVVQEIQESKELVRLLGKSRKYELNTKEKDIVNQQLMDILKTIPPFVIIALPFTFITLPIMLSLLPSKAFPSAFQE